MRTLGLVVMALAVAGCGPSLQRRIELSPTDGTYAPPEQGTERCAAAVRGLEARSPVPVVRTTLKEGAFGATDGRTVWLTTGLSSCGELETLSHELAHLAHPVGLTPRERQMFADAVSYYVVRRLGGYDPRDRYVRYLTGMKMDARVLTLFEREIAAAVADLTETRR